MSPTKRPASKLRRIHLTAVGGGADTVIAQLNVMGIEALIELAQNQVGDRFQITANAKMIFARETPDQGGRTDDAARGREIETLLANDNVAAIVTIRGGAWFTRILDRINFDVLKHRRTMIYIFGFSEMTPLIAIAGQYPKAVGVYDLGPGFLYAGMKRYASKNIRKLAGRNANQLAMSEQERFADEWAAQRYPAAFADFFNEIANVLTGHTSPRVPVGRLLAGTLPAKKKITITGGNLSLISPMVGTPFVPAFETQGKWLALEDLNVNPDRVDRFLAGLKLAGLLERAEGIILGDFHNSENDFSKAVFKLLKYHMPAKQVPIVALKNFGHIWPLAPIPIHREVTLCCQKRNRGKPRVTIQIPWNEWAS